MCGFGVGRAGMWSSGLKDLGLILRHFQVGSYRSRSLLEGPYTF